MTSENFAARLAQAKLATKDDIADFVKKKTDFNDKLKNLNTKFTSNKTKNLLVENNLDELCEKVKVISSKGLVQDLINKYKILNGAKKIFSSILQNCLVFISANKHLNISGNTFAPTLIHSYPLTDVKSAGHWIFLLLEK